MQRVYILIRIAIYLSDISVSPPLTSKIEMWERLKQLVSLSLPMIGNAILSQMINLITMLYVGRIDGALYMGAATLGNML